MDKKKNLIIEQILTNNKDRCEEANTLIDTISELIGEAIASCKDTLYATVDIKCSVREIAGTSLAEEIAEALMDKVLEDVDTDILNDDLSPNSLRIKELIGKIDLAAYIACNFESEFFEFAQENYDDRMEAAYEDYCDRKYDEWRDSQLGLDGEAPCIHM